METIQKPYQSQVPMLEKQTALRMMLYIAMASITMFFAVTTSALLVKKADALNWAQFPLPSVFSLSTLVAILSSISFFYSAYLYKKKKFTIAKNFLLLSAFISILFLVSQYMGFIALTKNDFPLNGNVAGSFIYFLAIIHGLHIIGGVFAVAVVSFKINRDLKKPNLEGGGFIQESRVFALELLTSYWHFVNALWVYLFLFFYFIYQ